MRLLLDTCAMLWFAEGSSRLSEQARKAVEDPAAEVCVSVISAMELACLVDRNRIRLQEHWRIWWHKQLEVNGWTCLPITLDVAEEAYSLPEPIHRDPSDRILIATARLGSMSIVTGDDLILNYPHAKSMR